ncbi:hypothetical protein HK100_002717 [Physocladia obscura]|uniref:Uncharacterized protein n=1 Tax=Physocladia obscura TaxID=109957 RepID=A0AAD5T726_9FUNG|nr:hypothetical protein HK100_002717 [Physocladia obscura]
MLERVAMHAQICGKTRGNMFPWVEHVGALFLSIIASVAVFTAAETTTDTTVALITASGSNLASASTTTATTVATAEVATDPFAANAEFTLPLSIEWDTLRNHPAKKSYALNIKNPQCSQDIVDTLDEANLILDEQGFSDEVVLQVSGNDETATEFRSHLISTKADFQTAKRGFVPHTTGVIRGVMPPVWRGHRAPLP